MLDNLAMSMLRFSITSWYIDNYLSWTSDGGGSTLVAHELVVLYTPLLNSYSYIIFMMFIVMWLWGTNFVVHFTSPGCIQFLVIGCSVGTFYLNIHRALHYREDRWCTLVRFPAVRYFLMWTRLYVAGLFLSAYLHSMLRLTYLC